MEAYFLLVLYLQWHEIGVGFCIPGGHHGAEEHRVAHLDDDRAVGLLGQFACFDLDLASVGASAIVLRTALYSFFSSIKINL